MNEPKFNTGDRVYVYIPGIGMDRMSKAVITRVTKTQAIIEGANYEQKFNRATGRLIGGSEWDATRISHPSPELDAMWRANRIAGARRVLAMAAGQEDSAAIRAAYARWDRLESEGIT